jgi:uncharacterized damage-inducible protein DinB
MDGIQHFQRLFSYDEWANREVLSLLPSAPARSIELLSHIFSAERLWFERLQQRTQTFPVWPNFTREECARQAEEIPLLWREYFAGLPHLEATVSYQNTIGERFRNRVEDVLMHVYTHSAYHRGQIAANIRENGGTPLNTDLIHSIRQGFVE